MDGLLSLALTSQETQLFLWVEAGQVTLLSGTVSLSILPVFHCLSLKMIAEVPVQQISRVTVGIWSKQLKGYWHTFN